MELKIFLLDGIGTPLNANWVIYVYIAQDKLLNLITEYVVAVTNFQIAAG